MREIINEMQAAGLTNQAMAHEIFAAMVVILLPVLLLFFAG